MTDEQTYESSKPKRLSFSFAKSHHVFVNEINDDSIDCTHSPEFNFETVLELQRYFQKHIILTEVGAEQFQNELAKAYESNTGSAMEAISGIEENLDLNQLMNQMPTTEDLLESEDDAPVIRLLNAILTQAIKQGASDIHFETFEQKLIIRFRVDGVLREVLEPPRVIAPLLTSRLKIMAKLDIAEKRLPQDGRIALKVAGRAIDIRVSTIPTHYGERIVLRILDKQSTPLDLSKLGMSDKTLKTMNNLIHQPHGIILVTGPTGSGKTTTLYAALTQMNNASANIMTVEDPIEYYLAGISQTQVNKKVDMTFARGLRAILRQDPDIVMVGEIRDLETVEMAVQASLTGHLVLSTLHTNGAIGAITRLRDMGGESYLIASTLIGVAAQRLVRTLCQHCKQDRPADNTEKQLMGIDTSEEQTVYEPKGCERCGNTGYIGRTGIYEIIAINDALSAMIHANKSEADVEAEARKSYPSMRDDGWRRVIMGDTTVEEVLRVTAED